MDVDEREVAAAEIAAMDDTQLAALIAENREELPAPDPVPDGTAADVLAWVGEDPARARAAVAAEERRDRPRATLIRDLRRFTGPD